MLSYLPFKATKNAAFRLYFSVTGGKYDSNLNAIPAFVSFSTLTFVLSKDGANFANLTNAPVETNQPGFGYVDLTATEMNADAVMFFIKRAESASAGNFNCANGIVIYTTTSSGSSGLNATDLQNIADIVDNACGGYA